MANIHGFGIIGTGVIGGFHAGAIGKLPNAKLIGVYDAVEERARKFADEHHVKAYSSLESFLSDGDIDVVTIGTPSGSHMEPTVAAARAGKHVICEKPMEVTLARIDAMIEAHAKAGTKLGGVFNLRYEPVNQMLKKAIASDRLGRITCGGAYVPWYRPQQYYDQGGWRGTWKLDGGGALMNQGIHFVDLLQWLMGSQVKRVSAFTALLGHTKIEVEDVVSATLEFDNGALGLIQATTASFPGLSGRVELMGTQGTIISEGTSLKVFEFANADAQDAAVRDQFGKPPTIGGAADPKAIGAENHIRNFASFLSSLDSGADPEVSGVEARKAVQIILAVYESARTERIVEL